MTRNTLFPAMMLLTILLPLASQASPEDTHWRLASPQGPIHLFLPAGVALATAPTVLYVHGYTDTADSAWQKHALAAQFGRSGVKALFVVPEAPASAGDRVRFPRLDELLARISAHLGEPVGTGPLIAVGHSGAYRTIAGWLDHPALTTVALLDGFYAREEEFGRWLQDSMTHRLVLVSALTFARSRRFAEAARADGIPANQLVLTRSPLRHMELVTGGQTIPAILSEVAGTEPRPDFAVTLAKIADRQRELATRFRAARTAGERAGIRGEARGFVVRAITDEIFPPWLGTPWHMGKDDDAAVPHQAGKRVSCSQFVTAVLLNVGLRLDSRRRWAEAAALHIQRSLAPAKADLHRYLSITPPALAAKLSELPEGLYVIGLNCHVGFIEVSDGRAWFIHSNYCAPEEGVTREPVESAQAIANSQQAGYWVTPLFQDDRLIDFWLKGEPVPLQKLGQ